MFTQAGRFGQRDPLYSPLLFQPSYQKGRDKEQLCSFYWNLVLKEAPSRKISPGELVIAAMN